MKCIGIVKLECHRQSRIAFLIVTAALSLALAGSSSVAGQLTYTRGQNVSPAFEGWEQRADGTRYFIFGYLNRNWEEELDVPVGTENSVQPG